MKAKITLFLVFSWMIIALNCHFFQGIHPGWFSLGTLTHSFIPWFFAYIFSRGEGVSFSLFPNRLHSRHFVVWFTALFLAICAIFISTPFIEVNNVFLVTLFQKLRIPFSTIWWVAPLFIGFVSLIGGFTLWMLIASGQEAMFRIYLPHKWKHWSFSKMWLTTAFIWFLWYAPIMYMNEKSAFLPSVILKALFYCASLSFILLLFTKKEKGLAIPAIFMGVTQGFESSLVFIAPTANRHIYGTTGWIGVGTFVIAAIVIYAVYREEFFFKTRPQT